VNIAPMKMKTLSGNNYYVSKSWLLLILFDWAARQARPVLVAHYGREFAGVVGQEARREFEALIPQLPYIGGMRNPHTQIIVAAALFLALYRALQAHGRSADEVGALAYQAVEAMYAAYPKALLRFLGRVQGLMYGGQAAHRGTHL
jgi:hypothetical protein